MHTDGRVELGDTYSAAPTSGHARQITGHLCVCVCVCVCRVWSTCWVRSVSQLASFSCEQCDTHTHTHTHKQAHTQILRMLRCLQKPCLSTRTHRDARKAADTVCLCVFVCVCVTCVQCVRCRQPRSQLLPPPSAPQETRTGHRRHVRVRASPYVRRVSAGYTGTGLSVTQ